MKKIVAILLLFCTCARAQQDALPPVSNVNRDRTLALAITSGIVVSGSMYLLNKLWYKKFPKRKFHFFNDNAEWMLQDKAGHATTAYNLSAISSNALRCAGYSPEQSAVAGSATGFAFLSLIELLDGFSSGWGFSPGDMLANSAGSGLYLAQYYGWNEQRMQLKFSCHFSIYSFYDSKMMGSGFWERVLKDYNGQTYWLSANLSSFLPANSDMPRWLNISAGVGAEGMLGARRNPFELHGYQVPEFNRRRVFAIAPDVDLLRIGKSPEAIALLSTINFLKIPAPALLFKTNPGKFYLRPFYF